MSTFPSCCGTLFAMLLSLLVTPAALAGDQDPDAVALRAAVAVERVCAPAPRFERRAFLVRHAISRVSLSPDGRYLSYLREQGHNRSVWMMPTAGGKPRQLLLQTEAAQVVWSRDSRWLLLQSSRQLFALAAGGQGGSGIVTTLGGRERRELQAVDPVQPAAVIIVEHAPATAQGAPRKWRLLRVDMHGKRALLREDMHQIAGFAFDPQGRLAYIERVEGEDLVIHRINATGGLHELIRCVQMERCGLLPMTNADGELLLRSDHGGNLLGLFQLDVHGAMHLLHGDPRGKADLDETMLDPVTGQPLVATYRGAVAASYGLTTGAKRHVKAIAQRFPGRDLDIEVSHGEAASWLVGERGTTLQAARWHLYDPHSGRFRNVLDDVLIQQRSATPVQPLPESALAPKIPLSWRASDGMHLHGFLLLPPGVDPAHVPLVVKPHGGPWGHDRPEYGSVEQFLVNRGYAVFEPNFRGSTGYGRDYVLAAHGDFGNGRVQQDIVDGTRFLLAQGIGDAQRVSILGASFGGYSALLGVTFEPQLFKVGVAIVPPPDFGWNLRWVARSAEALELSRYIPFKAWLRMLSLDPDDGVIMARLHAQSPLANAHRMHRPLLLIAGGEDHRVALRGVTEYAAQLKLLGKDVSLLVDPEAGHSTDDPVAKEATFYLIETMLHRHLGGAMPTPPDPPLHDYLERNLRIVGANFRVP